MKTKKINIKKKNIIPLYNVLKELSSEENLSKIFSYLLLKNIQYLEGEAQAVGQLAITPSEQMMKYENDRRVLCEKYATKDNDGNPVIVNNTYVIVPENQKEFIEQTKELYDKNKEEVDKFQKQKKELEELLETETEVEIFSVSFNFLPEVLSPKKLEILMPIVEEPEEALQEQD